MPTIPLRPDVVANPMRSDLAIIEAVMVYPGEADESLRTRVTSASHASDIPGMLRAGVVELSLTDRDQTADFIEAIHTAPTLAQVQDEAKKRLFEGWASGVVVHEMLMRQDETSPTLTEAKEIARAALNRMTKGGIEQDAFGRKWTQFRPVAHLWGAAFYLRKVDPEVSFPCRVDQLPELLAVADLILRLGAAHAVDGRRRTADASPKPMLLDMPSAWHPAPEIIQALPDRFELA